MPFKCGGSKTEEKIIFTVDLQETPVANREAPAAICSLCANEWLSDDVATHIESIVDDAKKNMHLVEVTRYINIAWTNH